LYIWKLNLLSLIIYVLVVQSRDYRGSLDKSQIGLIFLKPIVGYSTSVYFHVKREFNQGNRIEDHDSRYAHL